MTNDVETLMVQFSKDTQEILENFANINPAMVFRPGDWLSVIVPSNAPDLFAFAQIKEPIPSQFAIADVHLFLSLLSLFQEPELRVSDRTLTIVGSDKRQKVVYTLTSEKLIKSIRIEDVELPPTFVSFELTATKLQSLKKYSDIADLPDIEFCCNGETIRVRVSNKSDSTSNCYIADVGKCKHKFNIGFDKWKIATLLNTDYVVTVCEGVVQFFANWNDIKLNYYIAPEIGSSFQERLLKLGVHSNEF